MTNTLSYRLSFQRSLSRFFAAGSLLLLVLSGCRTYGDYGSEKATFDQIVESNAVFTAELEKARGELMAIEQAAGQHDELVPYVEHYKGLLEMHEKMLEQHKEMEGTLTVQTGLIGRLTPAYRNLNRALGNIAAEQAAMRDHYYTLVSELSGSEEEEMLTWSPQVGKSRYQAVPPFYRQIQKELERKTLSAVLEARL